MAMKMESPTMSSVSASGAHIRSRITVVCAECKRLKLKCDRRTPCSSCLKRDTVPRCLYSAAAAEKIDVQSLHNRVLHLETQLANLSNLAPQSLSQTSFVDRAIIATGQCGSSVVISLEDVSGIWLETLDLASEVDLLPSAPPPAPRSTSLFHDIDFSIFRISEPGGGGGLGVGVTPKLVHLLPTHPTIREQLLNTLEDTLELHPCINFPHFRGRTLSLLQWADEAAYRPPGTPIGGEGYTLSFFSAVAAAFALASRVASRATSTPTFMSLTPTTSPPPLGGGSTSNPTSPPSATAAPGSSSSTTPPPTKLPSPSGLYTLAHHALTLHELNNTYDLDYTLSLLLTTVFLLHDGLPNVPHTLFPMIGKMVNVARLMGLYIDPDDGLPETGAAGVGLGVGMRPPRYGLFEGEMRRRIWWDVYYYDLFVSDAMGHTPLIQDDLPTCRLPTDVNEDAFGPASTSLPPPVEGGKNFTYFIQKCRLAQLVKNVKKRTFRDPYRSSPPPGLDSPLPTQQQDLSIDATIGYESEVAAWVSELPPQYRLDMLQEDLSKVVNGAGPILIAQRCEIATVTARLVIKLFVPFLKRGKGASTSVVAATFSSGTGKPPHHAVHACVNAAHQILHASKVAHTLFKQRSPGGGVPVTSSESLFYSFGRQLFDAAVISAHSVITAPQSLFAKVAMEDLKVALEIMRDPMSSTGQGPIGGAGVEGSPSEPLKIVELLKAKAEAARSGIAMLGTKRKHSEVEEHFPPGFQLPYVGAAVVTGSPPAAPQPPPTSGASAGSGGSSTRVLKYVNERTRDKERSSKVHASGDYPKIGVRVRTTSTKSNEGRSRAGSVASVSTKSQIQQQSGAGEGSPHPVTPSTSMPPPLGPASDSIPFPTASSSSASAKGTSQQPPPSPVTSMHPDAADYGGPSQGSYRQSQPHDDSLIHYPPGPHAPSYQPHMYEPSVYANGSSTPTTPSTATAPYYLPTSYQEGYDTTSMHHSHPTHVNMSMMMHPPHPPHMDTSGASNGVHDSSMPGTPHDPYPSDKTYKTDVEDPGAEMIYSMNPPSGGAATTQGNPSWPDTTNIAPTGRYQQQAPPGSSGWNNYGYAT